MKPFFMISIVIVCFCAAIPLNTMAMDCMNKGTDCASCHSLSHAEAMGLLKNTGGTIKSIKMAPIKGLFELLVEKDGKQGLVYIDFAKQFLMQGFMLDFKNLKPVSAHADELPQFKGPGRIDIQNLPFMNGILLGKADSSNKLYVFTDPDCPYCRKFHLELKKLLKLLPDLSVYVLPYPLPMHPEAYDKSRAILTFKNASTLDKAFEGASLLAVGTKDGSRELNEIINFARRNGITATPSIVLSNGDVISGFKTAEELKSILSGR